MYCQQRFVFMSLWNDTSECRMPPLSSCECIRFLSKQDTEKTLSIIISLFATFSHFVILLFVLKLLMLLLLSVFFFFSGVWVTTRFCKVFYPISIMCSSSNLQVLQTQKKLDDKRAKYNWFHHHFHIPQLFKLPGKTRELFSLFPFLLFHSSKILLMKSSFLLVN